MISTIIKKLSLFQKSPQRMLSKHTKTFWFFFSILVVYMECLLFGHCILWGAGSFLFLVVCGIALIPVIYKVVLLFGSFPDMPCIEVEKSRNSRKVWIKFFVATYAMCLLYFLMCYPGNCSPDTLSQYSQALSGKYNNWHPVLHTWLFFTLPMLINNDFAMIISAQLFYFNLAVAYLIYTLYRSGCSQKFLILSWLFIMFNPNTIQIMLYPWKDSAMSILALVLFTQLINVFKTEGEWLSHFQNITAFSIIAFLTTGMRHNAVLLTAPVYIILFLFMKKFRLRLVLSGISIITAFMLLYGPVFNILGVQKPDRRTLETVGLPMTILCAVYTEDKEALSEDTEAFMDSLVTSSEWEKFSGTFNSVKFGNPNLQSKVDEQGMKSILQYTFDACIHSPKIAVKAIVKLTCIVWTVDTVSFHITGGISENDYGIEQKGISSLRNMLQAYGNFCSNSIFRFLFCDLGLLIIIIMILVVGKVGRKRLSVLSLVLAPIVYDFGTMLLLSGYDYRFFHFNFLIFIPLLYLIRSEKSNCTGCHVETTETNWFFNVKT